MSQRAHLTDLELAALISSKICHDVIGPVGAIYNGLEILDEDDDIEAKTYALDVIRNVTETASARLQFARFAFGATDSAGAKIDLGTAESLSRGLIGNGKHRLAWHGLKGQIAKDKAKLLLNLVAVAPTAVPRGGDIDVEIAGTLASPGFIVRCSGPSARPPQYLGDFLNGTPPPVTALTIQAYYTVRLAATSRMRLGILKGKLASLIKEGAHRRFFMHRTGHWLGMDVHDVGDYKIGDQWRVLEPGMVLTVEPGIYIPAGSKGVAKRWWNIGVRIEDDVAVTPDGCENLTHAVPKRLDELEALAAER